MKDARDRDAAVDRWLRQASAGTPDVPSTAACLDPEVMAAWVDGRLTGTAFASAEAHVAGCARCQAIVGAMMRTASIAEWAAPERRSLWRWLTWAVPLTAAATIATVVLVEWRPRPQPVQTEARADAPAADFRKADQAPAQPQAAAPAAKPGLLDEARQGRPAPAQTKRADARDANEQERARSKSAAEAAAPPASTLAQRRPAEGTDADRQRAAKQKLEKTPAAPARAEELDRFNAVASAVAAVLEIRSPDAAVRWRVSGLVVQRTVDAGSTWTNASGVTGTMTAGAAPSSSTCWLVGRGGVVWLTTDGTTWQRVSSPDTTDLSAIRATDSRTATVTTADGREFATTDGGRTWVRRDLQEIQTAPF